MNSSVVLLTCWIFQLNCASLQRMDPRDGQLIPGPKATGNELLGLNSAG